MEKTVSFLYDDIFLAHKTPPQHPESSSRLLSCLDAIGSSSLRESLPPVKPRRATAEEVALAHSTDYVEKMKTFGPGYLDPDTYVSEMTYEVALHAAGAVLTAVDSCLEGKSERAFCAVRPPGHHAEYGRGMGFCIFNNVAVGARYAQARGKKRITIVDFDVHHGNGTQNIFYEDGSVYYFSTHQYPHYPGTGSSEEKGRGDGKGYTLNIPLPAGAGDEELIRVYRETFTEATASFGPEMIFVSAGYDLHGQDPLAGFTVTDEGVAGIVEAILNCSPGVPVIFVLEGGYNLASLSSSVLITLEKLLTV